MNRSHTDSSHLYDGAADRNDWDGDHYAQGTYGNGELTAEGAQSSFFHSSDLSMLGYNTPENDYEAMGFHQTDDRRLHALEDAAHKDAVLDPGAEKWREFQRREEKKSKEHRAAQRREQRIAKKLGYESVEAMPVEILEAELHRQEDKAGDEALNAEMVRQMMADPNHPNSRSACYAKLERLDRDEKDRIEHRARQAQRSTGSSERAGGRDQRQRVSEQVDSPLPARDPGLSEQARIHRERDVCKRSVRATIEADVQAFLANGGVIQQLGPWMPEDEQYIFQGKIKPVPFNRWDYKPSRGGSKKKPLRSQRSKQDNRRSSSTEPDTEPEPDTAVHEQLVREIGSSVSHKFTQTNRVSPNYNTKQKEEACQA